VDHFSVYLDVIFSMISVNSTSCLHELTCAVNVHVQRQQSRLSQRCRAIARCASHCASHSVACEVVALLYATITQSQWSVISLGRLMTKLVNRWSQWCPLC